MNYPSHYDDAMSLKENLIALLDASGENPNSLSEKTGVNQPTIWRIINGEVKNPKRTTVEKLAAFFRVPTDSMYGRTPPPYVRPTFSAESEEAARILDTFKPVRRQEILHFLRVEADMNKSGHPNEPFPQPPGVDPSDDQDQPDR
jgi:transcriptional regulator with XRE-family HTH domain